MITQCSRIGIIDGARSILYNSCADGKHVILKLANMTLCMDEITSNRHELVWQTFMHCSLKSLQTQTDGRYLIESILFHLPALSM